MRKIKTDLKYNIECVHRTLAAKRKYLRHFTDEILKFQRSLRILEYC